METFVLIAGAWHGGWCWQRVTPLLRHAGYGAHAPTLTGLGERSHLARYTTDVEIHVQDVVHVLKYEDLNDVVLVGHSYGGIVTEAVAHRVPERIAHLTFVDALLPTDGRSVLETYADHGLGDHLRTAPEPAGQNDEPWLLPAPSPDSPTLRVTDPHDMEWMAERMTGHPMGTLKTPVRLGNPAAAAIPHTYVSCLPHPPGGLIPIFTRQVQADPAWSYREFLASHDPMITDPEGFVRLMLDIIS